MQVSLWPRPWPARQEQAQEKLPFANRAQAQVNRCRCCILSAPNAHPHLGPATPSLGSPPAGGRGEGLGPMASKVPAAGPSLSLKQPLCRGQPVSALSLSEDGGDTLGRQVQTQALEPTPQAWGPFRSLKKVTGPLRAAAATSIKGAAAPLGSWPEIMSIRNLAHSWLRESPRLSGSQGPIPPGMSPPFL